MTRPSQYIYICGKIKNVNQTTNQYIMDRIVYSGISVYGQYLCINPRYIIAIRTTIHLLKWIMTIPNSLDSITPSNNQPTWVLSTAQMRFLNNACSKPLISFFYAFLNFWHLIRLRKREEPLTLLLNKADFSSQKALAFCRHKVPGHLWHQRLDSSWYILQLQIQMDSQRLSRGIPPIWNVVLLGGFNPSET